jgi:hypothetical protein
MCHKSQHRTISEDWAFGVLMMLSGVLGVMEGREKVSLTNCMSVKLSLHTHLANGKQRPSFLPALKIVISMSFHRPAYSTVSAVEWYVLFPRNG